jgi:hypothetical protein
MQPHKPSPRWLKDALDHATDYLNRFVYSPGLEQIVREIDAGYADMHDLGERLARLSEIAGKEWDFRKGRERFEVTESEPMDHPDSAFGKIVLDGVHQMEIASRSLATLSHYDVVAILGGANMSCYHRLRYALEQKITCNMVVFLGCERPLHDSEKEQVHGYALHAQTEFDLGMEAINTLLASQLTDSVREVSMSDGHFTVLQEQDGVPVVALSAPPLDGHARATTSDTYQFLRSIEQSSFAPGKNILFVTTAPYRYAQYFDAVRDITLVTGANIETIGYELAYSNAEFKPSKYLQELKSAIEAASRLYDAIQASKNQHATSAKPVLKIKL